MELGVSRISWWNIGLRFFVVVILGQILHWKGSNWALSREHEANERPSASCPRSLGARPEQVLDRMSGTTLANTEIRFFRE